MSRYLLCVAVVIGTGLPGKAAVIYQDKAQFLSAISSNYYLETFDVDLPMVEVGSTASFGPVNGFGYQITTPDVLYLWGSDFSALGSDTMGTNMPFEPVTFDLSASPVTAFGGRFFVTDFGFASVLFSTLHIVLDDGTSISVDEPFESSFVGFTSNMPITSVTLTPSGGGFLDQEPYATFDDVIVGVALPEPGSLMLVAFGLGMLCRRQALSKK